MSWIEDYRRQHSENTTQTQASEEARFAQAARERWRKLGEELQADVAEFDARRQKASFSSEGDNLYRVRNSATGLELVLQADFENCVVAMTTRP